MTGHVRARGQRTFEMKYDVGTDPLTGKRKTRYASFKGTKKQARVELARLVAEHAAGNGIDPSKATVGEFLTAWLNDWAQQNVSPLTHKRYEAIVRLYVIPRIGNVPVQKLKPQHLQSLYADLGRGGRTNARPLSPRSVKLVHKVLSRALGHALTWGTVSTNATKAVKAPPVPHSEVQILTAPQIGHLLKATEGHELRPLFVFLLQQRPDGGRYHRGDVPQGDAVGTLSIVGNVKGQGVRWQSGGKPPMRTR